MREFQVNEFITLRLEQNKTNIYVASENFRQCKYLLLEIPVKEITALDDIESIDDAAERLDNSLEGNAPKEVIIPPEVEFWGHCSNLQVWYEHDYDTRLLHSNLAFPLLKKLTEVGDSLAKKVFKEEIAKRIESGNSNVIFFLIKEGYLEYLTSDEIKALPLGDLEVIRDLENIIGVKACIFDKEGFDYKYGLEHTLLYYTMEKKHIIRLCIQNPSFPEELTIPKSIGKLNELKELTIYNFLIENIEDWIGKLTNLEMFKIYSANLKKIHKSIGNLTKLKDLNLRYNNLIELPQEIGNLQSLQILNLASNNLVGLPETIGNLISLQILILANNNLKTLPESIINLSSLQELNIVNNYIKMSDPIDLFIKGLKKFLK